MRTTLIVLSITALLAVAAGSAAANPQGAGARTPGSSPVALQHRYLGRDLVAVAPDTQVAALDPARSSGAPAAPVAEPGFKWGDAAIGAGLLAAVLALSAGALALARRDRPVAAR
jgi:hypothetical protein